MSYYTSLKNLDDDDDNDDTHNPSGDFNQNYSFYYMIYRHCHFRFRSAAFRRFLSGFYRKKLNFVERCENGRRKDTKEMILAVVSQIPIILIAIGFAILDNVPYGLLIFPKKYEHFTSLVTTMVILSTSLAQVAFSIFSLFPFGASAFISENVPLLHRMSLSVSDQLEEINKPEMFISTILTCFILSSLLASFSFWFIGKLKYGTIAGYIPREVLLGYMLGMGTFIVTAGIGIATGVAWTWCVTDLRAQFSANSIIKLSIPLAIEMILLIFSRKYKSYYIVPCVLASVPVLFYCYMFYYGISMDNARSNGWLFNANKYYSKDQTTALELKKADSTSVLENFSVYSNFSFEMISWEVVSRQYLNIITIVFFSVLNAIINVSSLSSTTKVHANLNYEMKIHGAANLFSAAIGGFPCYMTYSTSVVLKICGLTYRLAYFFVAFSTLSFIALGPDFLFSFFPRPAAAIFLIHIGTIILVESVIKPYVELDRLEYAVVWIVGLLMQFDFIQGIGLGLMLSFVLFVLRASYSSNVSASLSGGAFRSKKIRHRKDVQILEETMNACVHIIQLQGCLFFGNAQSFCLLVEEVLEKSPQLKYLIVDFPQNNIEIDCSGVDKLATVVRLTVQNNVMLLCSGMSTKMMERVFCLSDQKLSLHQSLGYGKADTFIAQDSTKCCFEMLHHCDVAEEKIRLFVNLEHALMWCEERLLIQDYSGKPREGFHAISRPDNSASKNFDTAGICLNRIKKPKSVFKAVGLPQKKNTASTNELQKCCFQADDIKSPEQKGNEFGLLNLEKLRVTQNQQTPLVELLSLSIEKPQSVLNKLVQYFFQKTYQAGDLLWKTGDPSHFAVIVQTGLLAIPALDDKFEHTHNIQPLNHTQLAKTENSLYIPSFNDCYTKRTNPSSTSTRGRESNSSESRERNYLAGFECVVLKHPVWNERLSIHKNYFTEYFSTGDMAGEVGLFAKDRRVSSLMALETSNVWCLTSEAVEVLTETEPCLLCILQNLAIQGASHRLSHLMLHHTNSLCRNLS